MEDQEIVQLFWEHSEAAIKETEIKYGARLHQLAMKILNSRLDAEESVNDTFLETWNTIPPKKPDYFFAYIAKICRYLSFGKLDWKNAKKRSAELVALTSEMELCAVILGCGSRNRIFLCIFCCACLKNADNSTA